MSTGRRRGAAIIMREWQMAKIEKMKEEYQSRKKERKTYQQDRRKWNENWALPLFVRHICFVLCWHLDWNKKHKQRESWKSTSQSITTNWEVRLWMHCKKTRKNQNQLFWLVPPQRPKQQGGDSAKTVRLKQVRWLVSSQRMLKNY